MFVWFFFVFVWFLSCPISFFHLKYYFSKDQNMTESMLIFVNCQLCWLLFSQICFQCQVTDAVKHLYIWKRLFNSNHLLKPNTFNVIFWNEVTHMDIPTMVVHNHPSSWYYNRQFSCYIWNMLISDSSFATAGRSSLLVGPLESYYKEWPRL